EGSGAPLSAQLNRRNYNYDDYREKDFYFGISLGFNSSKHQVFLAEEFIGNPEVQRALGVPGPGFNVHGIVNYKMGEYFDFRALPGFTFATRNLDFIRPLGDTLITQRTPIESIFVEFPIHIRYKSAPYRDKRAFVIAGLNYSFDVASNSETRQANELIRIAPHDFQLEAGFGMQFFFPYFIFSPEIKFSQSITNTLLFNDQIVESRVMQKLLSQVFTISFHFEG
ncbi:MAG: outer membrane beta-barrel protein, partial [Bacteroidota bacterium]